MKFLKRILIYALCVYMAVMNISVLAETNNNEYSAEIASAPNGADAIISMTFDDGLYDTAVFLNKMFKMYDLKGSCMLISDRITDSNKGDWQNIFAQGYLEAQSHTATHMPLPSDKWAEANKDKWPNVLNNNTAENYQKEIVDTKTRLESIFDNDIVAFAPSNNTLSDGAYEVVRENYYAVRSGSRGIQTLSPSFGIEAGDWHNLYMRAFSDVKKTDPTEKAEGLKKFVDEAVSGNGWLVTLCHSIGKTGGDATEAAAEAMFKYIAQYQRDGKLVSMTFGDAVKYVRERQQSQVTEFENINGLFVNVSMNTKTEDNLELSQSVFNYPLTVKAQIPDGWSAVSYSLNGDIKISDAFKASGKNYAYIDVVPNGSDVKLSEAVSVEKAAEAKINALYINGEVYADFDKNKLNYSIPLSPESSAPEVSAFSLDPDTNITVKRISFPGSTVLTAENSGVKTVYNINFYKPDGIYDFSAAEDGSAVQTIKIGETRLYNLSGSDYEITADNTTENFDGQLIINRDKGHATGNIATLSHPWYEKDRYAGQSDSDGNPEWYYSFKSTSDCRVYYVNVEGAFWPNKTAEWTVAPSGIKFYGRGTSKLRFKDFNAGEVINLPNFGADSSWTDETKKYYESKPGVYVIVQSKPESVVSSETLTIKDGVINGFGGKTIAEIKNALTLSDGCSIGFFDSAASDSAVSDDSLAARTMYAKVTDSSGKELYLTFGTADFEIGEIKTVCTDTSKKYAYKNGTLTAEVSVKNYTDDLKMCLVIAVYDNEGKLIDLSVGSKDKYEEDDSITAQLNIKNAENTKVKVMLFDSLGHLKSYLEAVRLTQTAK